ncbi:ecto-ADP-ribosyltransferase 3 isoform X2 [Tachyglossus aculeatus]|uniref:ecto-ADP-ribosyltransferase 3 isoform X2 n=1 Tax=Tachyglossus aculeatus TaxID=9261 RepID=UPI0018F55B81|nr:ecto-ADP-ribosyltransferase 3 isoform X2 [Tachyglossus aculeatus]
MMKTRRLEMVRALLAGAILVGIFQVQASPQGPGPDAFDDQYLKCAERMEAKFVPPLLEEERAAHPAFGAAWEEAAARWEARKARLTLPDGFKDNHGIAALAFAHQAGLGTPLAAEFAEAVGRAGRSRDAYVYGFPFKAFHFYLTRALQLLRPECEETYGRGVFAAGADPLPGGRGPGPVRLGRFTAASASGPEAREPPGGAVFTIHTCFGVPAERFSDAEGDRGLIVPGTEVFRVTHVGQDGARRRLVLHSTNRTCSHYDCAYLGGLKSETCVDNTDQLKPSFTFQPGVKMEDREREDPGTEIREPPAETDAPSKTQDDSESPNPLLILPQAPLFTTPGPPEWAGGPAHPPAGQGEKSHEHMEKPAPNSHPSSSSSSSGERHLPRLGPLAFLAITSVLTLFARL